MVRSFVTRSVIRSSLAALAVSWPLVDCLTAEGAWGWPFSSRDKGVPVAESPDWTQSYGNYQSDYTGRPMVAPGMGIEQPGRLERFNASVGRMTGKFTSSIKQSVGKVSDTLHPNGSEAVVEDEAISVFSNTPEASPDLLVRTAQLNEQAGRLIEARLQYERALAASPDYLPALLGMARLHDRQGYLEEAERWYVEANRRNPNDASILNDLGLCYARQGNFEASAATLKRAADLQPDRLLYRNNLATVLVELGRTDEAVQHLAAVHGPAIAHYNVGYLLQKKGDPQGALAQFQLSLNADPQATPAAEWVTSLSQQLAADGQTPAVTVSDVADASGNVAASPRRPSDWGTSVDHSLPGTSGVAQGDSTQLRAAQPQRTRTMPSGYHDVRSTPAPSTDQNATASSAKIEPLPPLDRVVPAPARY